jgi:N4-gp56 family major capsid protein
MSLGANELLGVAGTTVENRIFYEKQLLTRAVPMMLHTGWGLQKEIPGNMGNSINFRRFERPSAATTALTEGTSGAPTSMTVAQVNLSLLQYGAYDRVSDILLSQGIDDVMAGLSGAFGEQMGLTIDCLARNVLVAGTNVTYAGGMAARSSLSSAAGNYMSATLLKGAARNLQVSNARPLAAAGGNYVAFIHPDIWSDLFNDTLIQNALQYGGLRGDTNPLFSGSIFDYAGIRLQRTSNARFFQSSANAASTGTYATVVIGEEAYGEVKFGSDNVRLIVQGIGSAGAQDPLRQYGTVGWKASYGAVRLNENFIQRIETSSTQSAVTVSNATP